MFAITYIKQPIQRFFSFTNFEDGAKTEKLGTLSLNWDCLLLTLRTNNYLKNIIMKFTGIPSLLVYLNFSDQTAFPSCVIYYILYQIANTMYSYQWRWINPHNSHSLVLHPNALSSADCESSCEKCVPSQCNVKNHENYSFPEHVPNKQPYNDSYYTPSNFVCWDIVMTNLNFEKLLFSNTCFTKKKIAAMAMKCFLQNLFCFHNNIAANV